jgi:thiopurine S-methyltransferase
MDTEFWHERWHLGETGWHLDRVNPGLEKHWGQLALPSEARIFVPLCGKTEDLAWLAAQGHRIVGVELSPVAAEAFFTEHAWRPEVIQTERLRSFRADRIEILCGDYFQLQRADLGQVDGIYDRGALVALPPETRERYVLHLRALLPSPVCSLLVALDYPQHQMPGPPFAVSPAEVLRYFADTHEIQALETNDALVDSPRFRDRGVTEMTESVFALRPKTDAQA